MQDRVPLYPGRVTLTPVAGQENTFDMVRADEPTQPGTPLNKATLLKDVTASILGLPNTAVPDDAFLALTIGVGTYGFRVKIQLADGTPVEGATVSGIEALTGSTLVSGADGIVLGKSTSKTVTIGCTSPYIDQAAPASQSVTATGTITDVTLTLTAITGAISITSSQTVKVSPMAKTMDVTAVGGGGGGSGASSPDYQKSQGGGGGGGGNTVTVLAEPLGSYRENISIVVGAGGSGGIYSNSKPSGNECDGSDGGTTSVNLGGQIQIVSATGGGGGKIGWSSSAAGKGGTSINGGSGGDGGYGGTAATYRGLSGNPSTAYIFNDESLGLAGGGGGAGSGWYYTDSYPQASAGLPNGGLGGGALSGSYFYPNDGSPFGGGGGAKMKDRAAGSNNGGAGGVYLRFHF